MLQISIHAPLQGATDVDYETALAEKFQSTHPYRVRHQRGYYGPRNGHISIHAPLQGATKRTPQRVSGSQRISIHAPLQGATRTVTSSAHSPRDFNPRTLTGCDRRRPLVVPPDIHFNPRTLTGCDRPAARRIHALNHFNPRTLTGCDDQRGPAIYILVGFQSTHPYRVRPGLCAGPTL